MTRIGTATLAYYPCTWKDIVMTNITTDLNARMEKLVRDLANVPNGGEVYQRSGTLQKYSALAREIVADLPKPIDPDVLAVREILACWEKSLSTYVSLPSGKHDLTNGFESALRTYKRIKSGRTDGITVDGPGAPE